MRHILSVAAHKHALPVLCAMAITLLTGCAAERIQTGEGPPAESAGIPFPVGRETADLTQYVVLGSDAEVRSAGSVAIGSALELDASAGGTEYALYRFNPSLLGAGELDSVSVLLEESQTSGAWLALANFAAGYWEWQGRFAKHKTFALDNPDYLSPAGTLWIAVIASSGDNATINALSVRTINPANIPPTADLSAAPTNGTAPLTVDFDASASSDTDSSIIEYAWDFEGDGLYDGFSDSSLASHVFSKPGVYTVKLRVTDDQFAHSSTSAEVIVGEPPNTPPVASLTVSPESSEVPFVASFDASASNDPDGTLVSYEWDWEGDGAFDSHGSAPTAQHEYGATGLFLAQLHLTDNTGGQVVTQCLVVASAVADSDWGSGSFSLSLEMVNGTPAIAYSDVGNGRLKYVRADNVSGAVWGSPQVISSGDFAGFDCSMRLVNGKPAISYFDYASLRLRYVRALDASGSDWDAPKTAASGGNVGHFNSLAAVNGKPAISYYDAVNTDLMYVHALDSDGMTWGVPITLDNSGDVGHFTSLALVNGMPAVSYEGNMPGVKFVRASDTDGLTWGGPQTLDGSSGSYMTSLRVIQNRPAISYFDTSNQDLKYIHASDPNGMTWETPQVLDDFVHGGQGLSLAIVNGHPAISYYDVDDMDLRYVQAVDLGGSSWNSPLTVDSIGDMGLNCSLATTGAPVISYYDGTRNRLKFIRF